MRIKKNDLVKILAGRDKGRQGKVLEILPGGEKVRVEGVNTVKRHVKAGRDPKAPQGGIIEAAAPLHISNVQLVCGHCSKLTVAKMRTRDDGKRVRFCPKCKEPLDKE